MKTSILFLATAFILVSCGSSQDVPSSSRSNPSPAIVPSVVPSPTATGSSAGAKVITPSGSLSGTASTQSGADPEVQGIMNDLDQMFQDIADEK